MTTRTFIMVAAMLLVAGCHKKDAADSKAAADKDKNKPIEVFTQAIEKSEIYDPIFFGGVVQARRSSPIFSAVIGIVQKVYQEPGADLKVGQPILTVRPQESIGSDFLPHTIVAPMAGRLARLDAVAGQLVRNDMPLGVVAKLGEYQTVIQATYQDLFQFKKGMTVDVLAGVETPIESMITGKVEYVSEQPEPDTGTYSVKVNLTCNGPKDQCQTLLRLGSYVKVVLKQNKRQGYKVSKRSLFEDFRKILVMTPNGKAHWVEVSVGNILGEDVEIVAGLDDAQKQGAQLVISFGRYPTEGDLLTVASKEESMKAFETKPASADSSDTKKKPAKKG